MRLLSFLNQVETTLALLRPDEAKGWRRRVNPGKNEASAWHPVLNLSLHIHVSSVGEDRHGLNARWVGASGDVLVERTFFCGPSPFDWQTAAETVAELAPSAPLSPPETPSTSTQG